MKKEIEGERKLRPKATVRKFPKVHFACENGTGREIETSQGTPFLGP